MAPKLSSMAQRTSIPVSDTSSRPGAPKLLLTMFQAAWASPRGVKPSTVPPMPSIPMRSMRSLASSGTLSTNSPAPLSSKKPSIWPP